MFQGHKEIDRFIYMMILIFNMYLSFSTNNVKDKKIFFKG